MGGIDPEDLFHVASSGDWQPVQALRADGADPSLGGGVGVGCLHWCQEYLGTVRSEDLVEPAAELRVLITEHKAAPASLLLQYQEEVAGLLGDPGTVGVGGYAGQVDRLGVPLDEEQHLQPTHADGVDGEAGRR